MQQHIAKADRALKGEEEEGRTIGRALGRKRRGSNGWNVSSGPERTQRAAQIDVEWRPCLYRRHQSGVFGGEEAS